MKLSAFLLGAGLSRDDFGKAVGWLFQHRFRRTKRKQRQSTWRGGGMHPRRQRASHLHPTEGVQVAYVSRFGLLAHHPSLVPPTGFQPEATGGRGWGMAEAGWGLSAPLFCSYFFPIFFLFFSYIFPIFPLFFPYFSGNWFFSFFLGKIGKK